MVYCSASRKGLFETAASHKRGRTVHFDGHQQRRVLDRVRVVGGTNSVASEGKKATKALQSARDRVSGLESCECIRSLFRTCLR